MDEFFKTFLTVMSTAGVAGVVLAYYLVKIVPALEVFKASVWAEVGRIRQEIRNLEEAMDRSTKADLLRFIASPHISDALKESAASVIKDVDQATAKRQTEVQSE